MKMRRSIFALAGGLILSGATAILSAEQGAPAQEPNPAEANVFYQRGLVMGGTQILPAPGGGFAAGAGSADRVMFISAEMGFESRVIEGAPYSAQAVTEHVQTLADGNRIVPGSQAKVEAVPGAGAPAAVPRGAERADHGRCRPIGDDPVRGHPASIRNSASKDSTSGGIGASNSMLCCSRG